MRLVLLLTLVPHGKCWHQPAENSSYVPRYYYVTWNKQNHSKYWKCVFPFFLLICKSNNGEATHTSIASSEISMRISKYFYMKLKVRYRHFTKVSYSLLSHCLFPSATICGENMMWRQGCLYWFNRVKDPDWLQIQSEIMTLNPDDAIAIRGAKLAVLSGDTLLYEHLWVHECGHGQTMFLSECVMSISS